MRFEYSTHLSAPERISNSLYRREAVEASEQELEELKNHRAEHLIVKICSALVVTHVLALAEERGVMLV